MRHSTTFARRWHASIRFSICLYPPHYRNVWGVKSPHMSRHFMTHSPRLQDLEGSHLAMSADCKGVRILKSERAEGAVGTPACARRRRGEKPSLKKDAVVVTDFSFYPQARTAQEIQRPPQSVSEESPKTHRIGTLPPPRTHPQACLCHHERKKRGFRASRQYKRDPTLEKPII